MPGQELFIEMKRLFFCVIAFTESEKNGTQIPLNTTAERYQECLGTSRTLVTNLEKEMQELEKQVQGQQKEQLEENKYRRILCSWSVMPKPLSTFSTSNDSITTASRVSSLQLPILKIVTVIVSGPLRTLDLSFPSSSHYQRRK